MVSKFWREWRHPVEFALLLALAFFLPLREAPKNIFWLLYTVAWMVERLRTRNGAGAPDLWDAAILALVASGYLAAALGGIHRGDGNEWQAVNDIWRYGLLFIAVRRGGYSDGQKLLLLAALVASCLIAELEAIWNWKVAHTRPSLELFSVGHVNHSAIYMTICLGIAAGLLAGRWRALSPAARFALGAAILVLMIGLFMGGSRAAGVTGLLILTAAAFLAVRAARLGRVVWLTMLLVVVVAAVAGGTAAIDRQIEWSAKNYTLAQRDLIWNRGLVGWREHPMFGLGMDNYGAFSGATLKAWVLAQGKVFDDSEYAGAPHAHSLYLNTLVERGAFGLAVLLALLAAWGIRLIRSWPGFAATGPALPIWAACASAWLVTVLIGFANTTLHHEHAMLAMLTFALASPPRGTASPGG